jgi:hypothetical protein
VQTLSGNYQIIDPDRMVDGVHEIVWNGLWRKGTRDRLPEFIQRYEELAPVVRRYLVGQRVYVAPFAGRRTVTSDDRGRDCSLPPVAA